MSKYNYLLAMPRVAVNIGVKYHFPIGIAYISAVMKEAGFNVYALNPNHTEEDLNSLVEREISKNNIDIVLVGGLSGQYNPVKSVVDAVKRAKPDVKIIVGGGMVTAEPDIAMEALEYADIGVIGEGEVTIVELCKALESGTPLESVLGIVHHDAGTWKVTDPRPEILDLDSIPFPNYEGFDFETYLKLPSGVVAGLNGDKKTFFCQSARSCPYQCTFCFHTLGVRYRTRSIENVLTEIRLLRDRHGIEQIVLGDELFAQDKKRMRLFSEKMKEMDLSWYGTFRIDQVDEELIGIIKNSTCAQMFFGLENVNNEILKSMRKNLTIEVIEKNLKLVYDAGIPFSGNLLFGDTEDTLETCRNNLMWYKAHPEYNLALANIYVYPGTVIYKRAVARGKIKDKIQFLKDGCPIINNSKMTDAEYSILQQEILSVSSSFPLENQVVLSFPPQTKHAAIRGNCKKCGTSVSVDGIVPLTQERSIIFCPKCGRKHTAGFPKELQDALLKSLRELLNHKNKIALWGIQPFVWGIFNDSELFENNLITFIDNNQGKQLLKVTRVEKPVFSPQILQEEEFDYVFFCYPHLYMNYLDLANNQYPMVSKFVDILDLMCL